MATTRVFKSGHSQSVRLPEELRFNSSEAEIFRRGNKVVLRELPHTAKTVLALLSAFSDDFMSEECNDSAPREGETV